ncbi:hypothetical protein BJX63DRAFT_437377 [Aspergillus granulosus]|uniref:Uncharacterized protein n=1 Tax=Aspergillus granulosus TaxID=176169 RepID=A0ABR4GV72_9EURO
MASTNPNTVPPPSGEGGNNAPQQETGGDDVTQNKTEDPPLKNIKDLNRPEQQQLIEMVAEGEPYLGLPDVIPAGYTGTLGDMRSIANNKDNHRPQKDEHPEYRRSKARKALAFLKTLHDDRGVSFDEIWKPRLGEDPTKRIDALTEDDKKKLLDISKLGEIKDEEHLQRSMPTGFELSPNEMITVLSSITSDESQVAIEVLRAAINKKTIEADDPLYAIDDEDEVKGFEQQGKELGQKALEVLSLSFDGDTIIEEIQALIPPGGSFQWEHLEDMCNQPWEGKYKSMAEKAKENLQRALGAMEIIGEDMSTIKGHHFQHKPKTKPEGWERQPYHWSAYTAINPYMREIINAILQHKGERSWYSGGAREAVQAIGSLNGIIMQENTKRGLSPHLGQVHISRYIALWTARVKAEREDVSKKAESDLQKLLEANHMPNNWSREQYEDLKPIAQQEDLNPIAQPNQIGTGGFTTVEMYGSEAITYTKEKDISWINYKEGYTLAGEEIELRAKKGNAIYFVVNGPQGRRLVDAGSAGGQLAKAAAEAANIQWVPTNDVALQGLKQLLQGGSEVSIGFKWWAMNRVDFDKLNTSDRTLIPDMIGGGIIRRPGKEDIFYPAWRGAFEKAFAPKLIQQHIGLSLGQHAMPMNRALAIEWIAKLPPGSLMAEQVARNGRGRQTQVSTLVNRLKTLYLEAPKEFDRVAPDLQRLVMAAKTKRLE